MTFAAGWEREYSRAIKDVSAKPVLAVGRINYPDVAESLIASGDADAVLLGRQMFADEQWMTKVKEGREQDIRNLGCPVHDPALFPKRVLVIGAGPAGLEYARIAAARGNHVIVYEREREVGGHVRAYGALPHRGPFSNIAVWLEQQAVGNGATIKTESCDRRHRSGAGG
jgi:NADPH-dependent 2,4-dienoyl-CoA reductase/sulfur reductase-like enzyme